ncbi:hypothetical protein LC087_11140 [Bacillus carboniphilus]|uniref:Uncharacterized protein n=1 Tax=Bacillus carboniphilus TaxID=86663 RepID=A0ABY9JPX2_9BACI|nr:hypothetical protein [Bacillus carboniphilus]WLR41452.1 hypothetical protein LC087_11140 [Bacillus carboniphilus]
MKTLKLLASAVNKTVVVSGAAVTGAVIGGAAGSVFGPIGTVAGATAGSFVGGIIGEHAAKLTAGFAEDVAIHFEDSIHSVTEGARTTFTAVGKGVNFAKDHINQAINDPVGTMNDIGEGLSKAKDTAESLVEDAKGFFEKTLSFS